MSPRLSTLPIALVGLSLAGMPARGQQAIGTAAHRAAGAEAGAVPIPAGRYVPLYAGSGRGCGRRTRRHRASADALPPAGSTDRNAFGVRDLHGLVWEWTADFHAGMLTGAGRDDRGLDRQRFCAAGSLGTTDLADYAGFLRWAFRAGLQGATTSPVLGFRCAR